MDWTGAVLACAGLFLIVFGFSHAETAGWTAGLTLGSLILGVVLLAAFVVAEQRVSPPLLPLRVILDRTRGGSYVAVGLSGIAIFAVFLFLTYYLQVVKGYSPLTSGLAFLPLIACILLSSNLSSIVALPRVGPRVLICVPSAITEVERRAVEEAARRAATARCSSRSSACSIAERLPPTSPR